MAVLSISRAWEETKRIFAAEGRLIITVAAATLLLPDVIVSVLAPPEQLSGQALSGLETILFVVAALIGLVGQMAIIRLALLPGAGVGESLNHAAKRALPAIGAMLLLVVGAFVILVPLTLLFGGLKDPSQLTAENAAGVGAAIVLTMLLILFVGVRFLVTMPVAAMEEAGPIEILKRSWSLTSGHYLRLLGLMFLFLVAAVFLLITVQLVGGAAIAALFGTVSSLSLGALVYALLLGVAQGFLGVFFSVMLARIYVQLSGRESLNVSVPSSGS